MPDSENSFQQVDVTGDTREWTTHDFSRIYMRYRSHLIAHAQRFLKGGNEAEELVQEAFLYLMVSMPELDSELGVLRFLKWKVRCLAIDLIKSAPHRYEIAEEDLSTIAQGEDDLSADILQAEDQAVVQLALSRLSARQRAVLISSVYEEKSTREIAEDLGIEANAVRQLTYRAKRAFRLALVGEADLEGKTVSQILSVASRRASILATSSVIAILLALGGFVLTNMQRELINNEVAHKPPSESFDVGSTQRDSSSLSTPNREFDEQTGPLSARTESSISPVISSSTIANEEVVAEKVQSPPMSNQSSSLEGVDAKSSAILPAESDFVNISETDVPVAGYYEGSQSVMFADTFQGVSFEIFGGTGISAFLDIDKSTISANQIVFQMSIQGEPFVGVATENQFQTIETHQGYSVIAISENFYVVNSESQVFSDSPLANATAEVRLDLDAFGEPIQASIRFN